MANIRLICAPMPLMALLLRRFVLAGAISACIAAPAFAQQPAVQVGTIVAAKQPISETIGFVGRIEAVDQVEIRPRVSGYLEAVLFKEGEIVNAGDKLFQIEPALLQAAVQQARGALMQAEGAFTYASLQRQRADELLKTNATSASIRDQRVADEKNAQGAVIRANADLDNAEINLGYASISAPITGRIGRALVTKGNLVRPESGPLTLIVSQDPMFITFPVSEREFLRIRQEGGKTTRDNVRVALRFADGSDYDQVGKVDFIDVAVDRSTDTVMVRARMPNPDAALIPNQFVRVSVVNEVANEKLVIPQAALIADQEGIYVFVVQDGAAVIKRVRTGAEVGTGIAIESGLNPGDVVIVNGMQSLRPAAPVLATPIPATLNPSAKTAG